MAPHSSRHGDRSYAGCTSGVASLLLIIVAACHQAAPSTAPEVWIPQEGSAGLPVVGDTQVWVPTEAASGLPVDDQTEVWLPKKSVHHLPTHTDEAEVWLPR